MEETEVRKRNVAYKLRIGDILKGVPIAEEGKFLFLDLNGKKISRVNLIANCIDRYMKEGEKPYATLTVDDASGQIRLKAFGEDTAILHHISQGDTLQIIAVVREWNGDTYLLPEIVKKVDSRWLLVRKLEIQELRKDIPLTKDSPLKEIIMQQIKNAEAEGGIDTEVIVMNVEANPGAVKEEVTRLLQEGLIYEPRPGKLRYLG